MDYEQLASGDSPTMWMFLLFQRNQLSSSCILQSRDLCLKKENHLSDRPSVRRHLCSQPLIDSLFQTATVKLDFKYHPQSDNSHPCMIVDECGCFTPNYMIVLAFYVHTHTHTRTPTPNLLVSPPEAHILGTIQCLWGFLGVAKHRRFEQPKCGVKLWEWVASQEKLIIQFISSSRELVFINRNGKLTNKNGKLSKNHGELTMNR